MMATKEEAAEATGRRAADRMYKAAVYFYDKTKDCDEVLYSIEVPQICVVGEGPTYEEAISDASSKVSWSLIKNKYYNLSIPAPYSDDSFYKDLQRAEEIPWSGDVPKKIGEIEVGPYQSEAEIAAAVEEAAVEFKRTGVSPLF